MLRRQTVAGFAALLIMATANGQAASQSSKGFELYSWKVKGQWHYSLLAGTNRVKSYDEIISRNVERIGVDELEAELKKIPRGTDIFWMGDAPAGAKRSPGSRGIDLKHPSRKRIEGIKAICDKLGINLKLA